MLISQNDHSGLVGAWQYPPVLDKAGHFFYGKLRLAMTHSKRWPAGKRLLGFLQRTEHELTRAEGYEYLLALAKHEVPLHEASDMLVQ